MEQRAETHNNPNHRIDIERDETHLSGCSSMSSLCEARVVVPLVSAMGQISASIVILVLSSDKKPPALLVAWVKAYTAGCAARLPLILSRSYPTLERFWFENFPFGLLHSVIGLCEPDQPRSERLTRCYKVLLDIYFVALCVTGIPLGRDGHLSAHETRELYRLFIAFFLFTFVWYGGILLELILLLCVMVWASLFCFGYGSASSFLRHSHGNLIRAREASGNLNQNQNIEIILMYTLPIYKYELQTNPNSERGDEVNSGTVAAGTEKERRISGDDAVCCICLAAYVNNDELKELPCDHLFHSFCVDKWLKINASCPLCKHDLGDKSYRLPSVTNVSEEA